MSYALNFDIIFAIALVGMIFSAIFKKSKRYTGNFFLFLLTTVVIGVLVWFKIDAKLFTAVGPYLQPMFKNIESLLQVELYGFYYFVILLLLDVILYLVIKFIIWIFTNERRKFKKDLTYTPKHHGFVSFLSSILGFALVLHIVLISFHYVNFNLKFNTEDSKVITYFEKYEAKLIEKVDESSNVFFDIVLKDK